MLPIGGALIGGALGGPVGIYAGMKVGAVAAFGGSAVGFLSGRFLKNKQNNQVQLELDSLSNDPIQRTEQQNDSSNSVENKDD